MHHPEDIKTNVSVSNHIAPQYYIGTIHEFDGVNYEVYSYRAVWISSDWVNLELRLFKKPKPKSPEQLRTGEMLMHSQTKLALAQADVDYWQKQLEGM